MTIRDEEEEKTDEMDDILSDIEIESEGKKQKEETHPQRDFREGKEKESMTKKGERQVPIYRGDRQFDFKSNERPADVPVGTGKKNVDVPVGREKKRTPSEYNIFIGECMHKEKDMKTCAAEYAEYKASSGRGKSNEKDEERDKEEFIGIFTEPAEVCPSCEEAKIKLEENLDDENLEIVELNITKDKKANDLYQLLGADKKGTPAFARFTKDTVCLLNDDLEVEEESCVATESIRKGKEKEKGKESFSSKRGERHSNSVQTKTQTSDVKNIYLITSTGCPACNMVKREMKNDIDRGLIKVLDIQESDFGADLVIKLHITEVPKLVYEKTDGTFEIAG